MAAEQTTISVIFPVMYTRNQAIYSLRKWSQEQTFPRTKYEIIILLLENEADVLTKLNKFILPHDQVIICDNKTNVMELYHKGVQAAKGEWVFFCEAHSAGEAECLQNAYNYVIAHQLDGAGCKSKGVPVNAFAQMEDKMYAKATAVRLQPTHWSKLFLRGTILKRQCYDACGGLQSQYGLFAEAVLSMNLHKQGYKLGYAPDAVVEHFNTSNAYELSHCVEDYSRGEAAYFHQHPEVISEGYFVKPDYWQELAWLDSESVKYMWQAVGKSLITLDKSWLQRFSCWLRLLPQIFMGAKWKVFKAKAAMIFNGVSCSLLSWNKKHLWKMYQKFHDSVVKKTQLRFLLDNRDDQQVRTSINTILQQAAHMWPNEALWGFYPTETFGENSFRWSKPEALMKLSLKPDDYLLTLTLPSYRQIESLCIYLNGKKIKRWKLISDNELIVPILKKECRRADEQYLVICCKPLRPGKHQSSDKRKLGLPIASLKIALN